MKINKDKKNCIANKCSYLAKQWHPAKNGSLTPYNVTYGSGKAVWWECKNGHEWRARVSHRSFDHSGCPYCAGNKFTKKKSLQTVNPKIAKQWHPTKNGKLKPNDISFGSGKKVWWKCSVGHEWQATIDSRTNNCRRSNCPFCSHHRVTKDTCLLSMLPDVSKEWDFNKNGDIKPSDVSPYSHIKVWWKCINGHGWSTPVYSRRYAGCPFCKGINLKCGAHCDSLVEAYFYLKYKSKKIKFFHNKIYGRGLGKRRYDFYFPNENKYIEITSFDNRHMAYKKYRKNINKKKRYVEKILGAKFEFVRLFLTAKQINYVRRNTRQIS